MEFDDGEMVVVRHEYEDVWTFEGTTHRDLQNDAFYAIRHPESYDLSDGTEHRLTSGAFQIPGDIYLGNVNDVAGYRKLLDAVEARLIARKEASNDAV